MAKRTPTKRTRAPGPAPSEPEFPDEIELLERGRVRWTIGTTDYTLRPLLVGESRELDYARADLVADEGSRTRRALALPDATDDEKDAKLDALRKARKANADDTDAWYARLFEIAEEKGRKFPLEEAPAWIDSARLMAGLLVHLRGPLPRGVA